MGPTDHRAYRYQPQATAAPLYSTLTPLRSARSTALHFAIKSPPHPPRLRHYINPALALVWLLTSLRLPCSVQIVAISRGEEEEKDMGVEMVMEYGGDGVAEEQGWETPRREECRIPVVPPCPPPPPRKRHATLELGKAAPRREPPKGGYFQPPDIESLFQLLPPRRRYAASSCA